jgi:hypothetical protein
MGLRVDNQVKPGHKYALPHTLVTKGEGTSSRQTLVVRIILVLATTAVHSHSSAGLHYRHSTPCTNSTDASPCNNRSIAIAHANQKAHPHNQNHKIVETNSLRALLTIPATGSSEHVRLCPSIANVVHVSFVAGGVTICCLWNMLVSQKLKIYMRVAYLS